MQNNQEAEFRDWVGKAKFEELVKLFNNSCGLKKQIISEEVDRRFNIVEQNYNLNEAEKTPIFISGNKSLDDSAEESQKLELYNLPTISPESLERRINRKLP